VINAYFRASLVAADIVWAYAGVRALYDDGANKPQDVGRDYTLELDKGHDLAPLLTVYGGKLTTFRRLAEDVLSRLSPFFPRSQPWTATTHLPGGDFAYDGIAALAARTQAQSRLDDLGICFGADLTAAEVRYLMAQEWAKTADDVLWRRSKLGLRFSPAEQAALERFIAAPAT
jgi:glycerol-3-phosphate dehydrogenase